MFFAPKQPLRRTAAAASLQGKAKLDRSIDMIHVRQIEEMVTAGDVAKAHEALDNLLALGPKNTVALKLRAQLYEDTGLFQEEARVWEQIALIDKEDDDLFRYLTRRHVEEREYFYFTEDLPKGQGRRFIGYSRKLVSFAFVGVMGCLSFLILTRLSHAAPLLNSPVVLLSLFGACVMIPWFGILWAFFTSVKHITLSEEGLTITTRVKMHKFRWENMQHFLVVNDLKDEKQDLYLLIYPDQNGKAVKIDFRFASSAIRSRAFFLREAAKLFPAIGYSSEEDAPKLAGRPKVF